MAHNRIYFMTLGAARTSLALRLNSVVKACVCLLQHEREVEIVADIVADIARANDISINYVGFGSVTQQDLDWLVDACDRMELWHTEGMRQATINVWESAK